MNRTNDPVATPQHREQLISTHGRFANRVWTPAVPLDDVAITLLIEGCKYADEEKCGLISTISHTVHWIENVHEYPRRNFFMDQEEYKIAVDDIFTENEEILGIFHSHPNETPWPTPRDIHGWPPFQLDWRYWIVTGAEVIEWEMA